jgi:hypothetical protein
MSKLEKIYWAVYRWIKWDLPYIHYDLFYGVKNLVKWFRIIWNDRNYDYTFMLDIMRFKIESIAKLHHEHENFHRESRMRICIKLIDRIKDEYYWQPHYEQIRTDPKMSLDLVYICRAKHDKAIKLLFKIMEQDIETWWI